ncbi:poly(A)-specific ribonuclease PARN-like isoform X2 [Henckelia pumila]|uniref:poly(A)-specific ribonuclease PARN-like isoform X2 n=1 Tax=Henckelia pumila TaxID=405737 RepID=UPI003C6E9232
MQYKSSLCYNAFQTADRRRQWPVKQVTKANFAEALAEIKTLIFNSDYVAVSMRKTGTYSSSWRKILPIDTAEIAYLKAKLSAERYQILQFSVCPFSVKDSKLIAHPFNFHLFPRDELKIGMPSYSFSCQSSHLTSMAREGISYLSKTQESAAKVRMVNLRSSDNGVQSSSVHSVADSVFIERIKSRVKNWRSACRNSNKTDDALISSLRKVIAGSELYGSRPCLSIDICSERQVELILEMLKGFADVVPLRAPTKGGGMQVVRVVLTCSEEDKNLLEEELQNMEEEQNRSLRGFRDVIDLISTSQKPVVAHNSLNDFASIYSKFLAPLPSTMDEFYSSLLLIFPLILDTNHLLTKCSPFEKLGSISGSISYLKKRLSAPIDMEIPDQESGNVNVQGHYVLKLCRLFVTLHSILKISPEVHEFDNSPLSPSVQHHANNFGPVSEDNGDSSAEDIRIWTHSSRRVSTDNLVFLLGFEAGATAGKVKRILHDSHDVFSKEFDIRMVDRTCAVVVFWTPGLSEQFMRIMGSGEIISGKLKDMISEGLRAVDYETYRRACKSVLWKTHLAECLDEASGGKETPLSVAKSQREHQLEICWHSDEMINLDEL